MWTPLIGGVAFLVIVVGLIVSTYNDGVEVGRHESQAERLGGSYQAVCQHVWKITFKDGRPTVYFENKRP